ncbi:MAG: PD-(D/E)XK nuclease family protein, partial [Actinomycetota bacterium]|nr:PD-(D/E)XK nuclease family protein [Actinomycetota bacterium]
RAPPLPPLAPVPAPPLHRVRRLSYSALALFERCSYRFYAERIANMRPSDARGGPRGDGLAATEIGDAVHRLLEVVDLGAPRCPTGEHLAETVRGWYASVTEDELARIERLVASYCESELAGRLSALEDVSAERPFVFEHDGVLLHGRLDVLARLGTRMLVVDFKTNMLDEDALPEDVVASEYRLQRVVYALACFRAGAHEVETVYHFLDRPDGIVTTTFDRSDVPALESELSEAIAVIQRGVFRPTPSEFVCAGCPVLDVVCAGPRLPGARRAAEPALAAT